MVSPSMPAGPPPEFCHSPSAQPTFTGVLLTLQGVWGATEHPAVGRDRQSRLFNIQWDLGGAETPIPAGSSRMLSPHPLLLELPPLHPCCSSEELEVRMSVPQGSHGSPEVDN